MQHTVLEISDKESSVSEFDLGPAAESVVLEAADDLLHVPQVPGGGVVLVGDLGAVRGHRARVHTNLPQSRVKLVRV